MPTTPSASSSRWGPNSILFGDGQIGGLATSSTKTARFNRNFYSGTARWDSWAGWCFTGDVNRIVTKQLAVRINTLYQKDTYGAAWRDGERSNDRGIDLALTYAVTPNTIIQLDAELDNRRYLNLATTYSDQVGYYTTITTTIAITTVDSRTRSSMTSIAFCPTGSPTRSLGCSTARPPRPRATRKIMSTSCAASHLSHAAALLACQGPVRGRARRAPGTFRSDRSERGARRWPEPSCSPEKTESDRPPREAFLCA